MIPRAPNGPFSCTYPAIRLPRAPIDPFSCTYPAIRPPRAPNGPFWCTDPVIRPPRAPIDPFWCTYPVIRLPRAPNGPFWCTYPVIRPPRAPNAPFWCTDGIVRKIIFFIDRNCSSQYEGFYHIFSFLTAAAGDFSYLGKKTIMETLAEKAFLEAGPIYHLYTTPLESDIYFHSDDDRRIAQNYIAISIKESDCKLLAYSIMTNHFHFVIEGGKDRVYDFFEMFKGLLSNYFKHHGRSGLISGVTAGITGIGNLRQLRNTIAYVIRNAFVVRPEVNVFADPWSTGHLYFNPFLVKDGIPASQLKGRALRTFVQSRTITRINPDIHVKDNLALAWSFVDYKHVEEFYDNAREFVYSVMKNTEAMIETALSCNEDPALNDEDLLPRLFSMSREMFKEDKPFSLDENQKKKLAVEIKNRYHSSNKQIARLLRLPLSTVDALYPLLAKR